MVDPEKILGGGGGGGGGGGNNIFPSDSVKKREKVLRYILVYIVTFNEVEDGFLTTPGSAAVSIEESRFLQSSNNFSEQVL